METITASQAITWGITILLAGIAATFALTKYSNSSSNKALQDRIELKDEKIRDYETRLVEVSKESYLPEQIYMPASRAAEQLDDKDATRLAEQIEELEKERERLLSELSSRASASLDPRSELSNLLNLLNSNEESVRSRAIEGLMSLKDPLSFQALAKFLQQHPDEATDRGNPYIGKWFSTLIEVGGPQGAEFVVAQLGSDTPGWSDAAYATLGYGLDTPELIDAAMPAIESAAFREASTLARTRAKLLIQTLKGKRKEYVERQSDIDAHQQRMEDINKEDVPSDLVILSVLRKNGLGGLATEMIRNGQNLQYWRTGTMISEEFSRNPDSHMSCIEAIQQLVAQDVVANSSRAYLYFLLWQMKQETGDGDGAAENLEQARSASSVTVDYLQEHLDVFRLTMEAQTEINDTQLE